MNKYKTNFNRNHYRDLKIFIRKQDFIIFAAKNLKILKI